MGALVGRMVRQKLFRFSRRGENPRGIQVGPANELFVHGRAGRRDVQLLELLQDEVVKVVISRGAREDGLLRRVRVGNRQAGEGDPAQVPNGDRRFPETPHPNQTVLVNCGRAFVTAGELGPARDVFRMTVGETSGH